MRSNPNGGRSGTLIPLYRRRTNLGRASRSIPAIHDFTKQNSLDTHSEGGGDEYIGQQVKTNLQQGEKKLDIKFKFLAINCKAIRS